MQFACPFCRRKPTIKVLTKYNPRAAVLCGLQDAMDDHHFFYAWCLGFGFAKRVRERVCRQGSCVPVIEHFRCVECTRPLPPRVGSATSITVGKSTPCPT